MRTGSDDEQTARSGQRVGRGHAGRAGDEVTFATKAVLATTTLARALEAGVAAAWAAANEAYGQDSTFWTWLEQHRIGYVVAVPHSQATPAGIGSTRADHTAEHAPAQAWKRRSAGNGAKGPRLYDWAVTSLPARDHTPPGWTRRLPIRRQITAAGKEPEPAYYLCCGPDTTSDAEFVRVAGARWAIEECFQSAKNEVDLDHYQVRCYDA